MQTFLGLLFFLFTICLVIFVHELGHLLTAKMFGVYCHEFSIGMGKKVKTLFVDKTGTEYNLRLIPMGGFVQIAGEDVDKELDKDVPYDQKLDHKPAWQRIIILFAGTFNNMLLCFIIIMFMSVTNMFPEGGMFITDNQGVFEGIVAGFKNFGIMFNQMIDAIASIFTQGLNNVSGLIGVADVSVSVSQSGLASQLFFIAMISINIGMANQLPIPMLDGGRILLVLYEVIFRKPISKKVENILMYGSVILLIYIFIHTGIVDLGRIFNR